MYDTLTFKKYFSYLFQVLFGRFVISYEGIYLDKNSFSECGSAVALWMCILKVTSSILG